MDSKEEVAGYVDSIVFMSEDTGFTVAKLKERSKKETTSIVGYMPSLQVGETILCKGIWKLHPQHGMQFEIESFNATLPTDLIGIQKYLESGLIKGIGPVYAKRIVEIFGIKTLDILEHEPERLTQIPGIGEKRIEQIQICWKEHKALREIMIFLQGHGIGMAYAQKIIKSYGERSIEKVKNNPFALAKDIFGIGFKIADKIANHLGFTSQDPRRIEAGIEYALWNLTSEGHTCYPKEGLIQEASKLLGSDPSLIEECLQALLVNGALKEEKDLIFVKPLYYAEEGIGKELSRLKNSACSLREVDRAKATSWVENTLKIELAEGQKEAVIAGLLEKVLIITGGPGTGKSTITKAILTITSRISTKVLLAAPTGRAAKRLSEITGHRAFTIHALLEMDFANEGFKKNKGNPLLCDLFILDEASMVDTLLFYHLLKAIPSSTRLIIVGDIDQLPSVGPGQILKDLINSEQIPVKRLTEIFRQAKGSRIITNAHRINQGLFPDTLERAGSDFRFIEMEDPFEIQKKIVELVGSTLPRSHGFHKFQDIQVLCPMKRGHVGAEQLNVLLQSSLNPCQGQLQRLGRSYNKGDKVMQLRNNYQKEVYNGDVGIIAEILFEEQILKVTFDEKIVEYGFHELDELILAYAVSVHKYQGSECPCVIIPVHISHFKLLFRNLLYTAITRGKRLVILIGTKKALAIAIRNEETQKRHTFLKAKLQQILPTSFQEEVLSLFEEKG